MANREIVVCSPARTAIGTYNGTLRDTPAVDLGAAAIKACLDRAKIDAKDIDTIVMGNVIQAGNTMNPARQANGVSAKQGRGIWQNIWKNCGRTLTAFSMCASIPNTL